MARLISYDISHVEEGVGGGSEEPQPAIYPAEIRICRQRETKADGNPANDIEVAFSLGGDYSWVWTYVGLGPESDWKLAEFIRALDLPAKSKRGFDPDKMVGKMVRLKINPDQYDGVYRARVGRIMKALPGDELAEEVESENGTSVEAEAEEETETEGYSPVREDADDDDIGSYDDWGDDDLESEVQDRGLTVPGGRGKKRDKWIKVLRADDEESGEEAEETDQSDEYDDWTTDELEGEIENRELELPAKPRGKNAQVRFKAKLVEVLREDDNADEDLFSE